MILWTFIRGVFTMLFVISIMIVSMVLSAGGDKRLELWLERFTEKHNITGG